MLLKTLWDIHSHKDCLWICWIHSYYLRGKGRDDHPLFKNILKLRDILISRIGSINNTFCVSKAYDRLRVSNDSKPWMRMIWRNYIPPKYSFILWLAMRGRLNTNDLWLSDTVDNTCVFCRRYLEFISHLFFKFTYVNAVWRRVRVWLNISRSMSTLPSAIMWIKKEHRGAFIHSKAVMLTFAATVYCVWIARNQRFFAGKVTSVNTIVSTIQFHVYQILHGLYPADLISFWADVYSSLQFYMLSPEY